MVTYKKNELYQEMELFNNDGVKIGEAEVDIEGKMLSRFVIYEPYQNQGYGTEFVTALCKDFGITSLWVNADNSHAIHVYEKCGFKLGKPKMYEMTKQGVGRMNNIYCSFLGHIPSGKTNTARIIMTDTYYETCKCRRCGCHIKKDQYGVWVKDMNIYPDEREE